MQKEIARATCNLLLGVVALVLDTLSAAEDCGGRYFPVTHPFWRSLTCLPIYTFAASIAQQQERMRTNHPQSSHPNSTSTSSRAPSTEREKSVIYLRAHNTPLHLPQLFIHLVRRYLLCNQKIFVYFLHHNLEAAFFRWTVKISGANYAVAVSMRQ